MKRYDWESAIRQWVAKQRSALPASADATVEFFRQAFEHTAYPNRSWFGVHGNTISLVVGNIFLAAVVASGQAKGGWALVDRPRSPRGAWTYYPTRSTQDSSTPLYWAHADDWRAVSLVLGESHFWRGFALASRDIFNARQISGDRDETQMRRGKVRLSDIRRPSPLAEQLIPEQPTAEQPAQNPSDLFGTYRTEAEFEDQVVEPLLTRFGWEANRQHYCQITLGTQVYHGWVDFLVRDTTGPITIVESKLRIANEKDLEFARSQARSYATAQELPSFVVAAPQGVWVYTFDRGRSQEAARFLASEIRRRPETLRDLLLTLR